jgi:hypothetical protein
MSPHLLRRWAVATLVGLGAWAGTARADETIIVVPAKPARTPLITWPSWFKAQKQEQVVVVQKQGGAVQTQQGAVQTQQGAVQTQEGVQQVSVSNEPNVSYDPDYKTVRRNPFHDWMDDRPRSNCCWADYNTDYGCSSLHSECVFIFGSCRHFWREPCFRSPPPSPFGPAYDCPPGSPCAKP